MKKNKKETNIEIEIKKDVKKKTNTKKIIIIVLSILVVISSLILSYILFGKEKKDDIKFILNGKKEITLEVFDEYKEISYKLLVNEEDMTKNVKVKGKVDTKKIGEYKIQYIYNDKVYDTLKIKVVDTTTPQITLVGEPEISLIETSEFLEPGAKAMDNYDGDISDNITIIGKVDTSKVGEYTLTYQIKDSSNNENSIIRKVKVTEKPKKIIQKIVVEDNKSSIPQAPAKTLGLVNNITFNDSGFYIEGCADSDVIPTGLLLNDNNNTMTISGNCYSGNINVTALANGKYNLYINSASGKKDVIDTMDTMLKVNRARVSNKLITFDYTNNKVSFNISDFAYAYDVIIDVGHGGSDTGATNLYNTEKNMNLIVSLYEKQKYEQAGLKVLMIRTDDTYGAGMGPSNWKALYRRAYYMGYYGVTSKVIYSNHHNASSNASSSGFEIYASNMMGNMTTEIGIFNAVKASNIIKTNSIYGRDYNTSRLYNKTGGATYNLKNYYAILRIPSELFNVNNIAIYENCYISNVDEYIKYWNNEEWKKISDIKTTYYIKKIKG